MNGVKGCVHYFRILREDRPAILYIHRLDNAVCLTHKHSTPTDCRCEPDVIERPEMSSISEFAYEVRHQDIVLPLDDGRPQPKKKWHG